MKKIYIVTALFLGMTWGHAQTHQTRDADRYYDTYQYTEAIKAYKELAGETGSDAYVFKQLGNSYYNIFDMDKAAHWFSKAIESGAENAEVYYRYAQSLKSLGAYKKANAQMDKFADLKPDDPRAKAHLKNPDYIPSLTKGNDDFKVERLRISDTHHSDFAPVLTGGDQFYFVSARGERAKDKDAQPDIDIYKSERKEAGFSKPEPVKELNTRFHDGPITVSADGKTAIFARSGNSGYYKKTKDGKVKVAQQILLRASLVNGKWAKIEKLPFNSSEYSVTHPSLSPDGKTLYFTSDMPGGEGGTDIWKVSVNGNHYGKPVNLGPRVNTPGKEDFPFIGENDILYFSSRGHQGLGGLDIYKIDLSDGEGQAENMGAPINSKYDDFSFSYNASADLGFFASNRSGADNLYKATPECHVKAIARVSDAKTGKALPGAKVTIADGRGNPITSKDTEEKGSASFNVQCGTAYEFQVAKDGYESQSFPIAKTTESETTVEAALSPVEVEITDTEVKLDNIYFEFDKSNITKQGAEELDKLVRVMKKRPGMKILVVAHTDAKGNAAYNKKLSERRAQSTIQYIISKGIDGDRLRGKGVGSEDPKIDCRPDCSDEQRAENRRSEFLIVDSFDQ